MPKLPEYEATEKLQTNDLGVTAHEQAGRRIGPFYTEMAQATKEIADMEKANDDAIGKQLDAFLRFQAMEDKGSGGGFKVTSSGKGDRTLIGTGSNSGITRNYANLHEMSNGSKMLSSAAKDLVGQASSDTENGVSVLRGGSHASGDVENGVTVLRGGRPFTPGQTDEMGNPLTPLAPPTQDVNPLYGRASREDQERMLYGPQPIIGDYDKEGVYKGSAAQGYRPDVNPQVLNPGSEDYGTPRGSGLPPGFVNPNQSGPYRDPQIWPTEMPDQPANPGPSPTDRSDIQGWQDLDQGIDYG